MTCSISIEAFVFFLKDSGLSDHVAVLVNNAGVCDEDLELSLRTNCEGPARLCLALAPMMIATGRPCCILIVSSGDGELSYIRTDWAEHFAQIQGVAQWEAAVREVRGFSYGNRLEDLVHGDQKSYKISKCLLNSWTRVLAGFLPKHIRVNAVCPGDVATRMLDDEATEIKNPSEAADRLIWLTDPTDRSLPTGGFFRDGARIPW